MNPVRIPLGVAAVALGLVVQAQDRLVPAARLTASDPAWEVTVWATSPMLKNPTNLDFDSEGRMWVAEGVNYRGHYNRQPEGDRILVLEDTDGDGKADKEGVFIQDPELRAPMGVAVIGNQIVVSMAPHILIYTDVNGDRRFDPAVDKREVVLTGFNGRRHDHTVHSVSVGPDGQWYWNSGNTGALFTDKSGRTFRVGSAYDPTYGGGKADLGWEPTKIAGQESDDGHVWIGGFAARMNPDGSQVRILGHNFRNSYEQAVTSFGDVFQNDNDDPPRVPDDLPARVRQRRFLLGGRPAELGSRPASGSEHSHGGMASGRPGDDAVGRRLRRRFADGHCLHRGKCARREVPRIAPQL